MASGWASSTTPWRGAMSCTWCCCPAQGMAMARRPPGGPERSRRSSARTAWRWPAPTPATPATWAGRCFTWVTAPGWTLAPYLAQHTQLNDGWSVGLEYLYRRSGFDVVVSVDYDSLNATDGNYQGGPNDQNHYLHFSGLSSLAGDVSLIGHW